ncbi:hypothetical protein H2202_001335 [Exophiala xenobiotica]|nr:hypothetical protein H2202_001335 [Exophiala xenobiotica]KAK5208844.1 hypothetical protein LTR41_005241 [Exophiala xenobiotica]KAK5229282.1 hypothetical protein LTR47_007884 [Exophiala xenobiotica]KAK5248030.1 hypothetical protein LTS06_006898 [Exophiala xenobiotica]KAK5324924.1 hypothetical protein LTR93_004399 [Exophiala xenobiotica]
MTDPLSIATGVAGLLSLAGTVISQCYHYGCGVADAPEEAKKIAFEVTSLSGLLVGIQNLAKHHEFPTQDIRPVLQECRTSLLSLSTKLQKHAPQATKSSKEQLMKRLLWPLRKTDCEHHIVALERNKRSLSLALDTFSAEALMNQNTTLEYISDTLSDLSLEVKSDHANHRRQRILDWLSEYPYEAQYRRGYQLHCFKTCKWLLEHSEFVKWSQRRSSLLWMHGQAGSGKTIATSYVMHHLRHHLAAERHLLAYFYYDASTTESLTPETFFGAVVKQFCAQLPHIPNDVADAYSQAANRVGTPKQASQAELQRFLLELLRETTAAIIVIDGLDETPDYGVVCDFLTSIVMSGQYPLRVFISSRPEVDLRRRLGQFQEIAVLEAATEDDISLYVQSRINHDHRLRHMSDKMKQRVEFSLRADCHGMFRWVQCQLDAISGLRTDAAIKQALNTLPSSLEGAYSRILRTIAPEDVIFAQRALLWLAYASTPLTLPELAAAVVLEPKGLLDAGGSLDPDLALNDPADILEICGSLVSFNTLSGTARLAHHSVREFLTQRLDCTSEFYTPIGPSHRLIAESCLSYLLLDDFASGPRYPADFTHVLSSYPLLRYAATNWPFHVSMASQNSSSRSNPSPHDGNETRTETERQTERDLLPLILRLMTPHQGKPNAHFLFWLQIVLSDSRHGYIPPDSDLARATPLYYAASYGLVETVRALVRRPPPSGGRAEDADADLDLNASAGRYGGTAMHAAVWRQRPEILKILLDAGADPGVRDDNDMTPPELALWSKKTAMMALFPHGVRVEAKWS